jgi:hypothetical protein
MIKETVNSILRSLENSKVNKINGNIYQSLENVFDDTFVNEILDTVNQEENFVAEHLQKKQARVKLKHDNILQNKLKIIFSHSPIKKFIEKNYDMNVGDVVPSVWIDSEGYYIPRHTDDGSIAVAMQIYLGSAKGLGTQLYRDMESTEPLVTFDYKINCGYVMLNCDRSFHQTEGIVPYGFKRPSVYVRFRKADYNMKDYKENVYYKA